MFKKMIVTFCLAIFLVMPTHKANAFLGFGDIVFDPSVYLEAILQFLKESESLVENTIQSGSNLLSNYNEELALLGQIQQIEHQIEEIVNQGTQIKNQVEQIANQGIEIENQVEQIARFDSMLEDWAKQLAKLESGDLEGFLDNMTSDLETLNGITENSRGIMHDWENPDEKFDTVFDTLDSEEPLDQTALAEKRKMWNREMVNSSFDSIKTLKMLDSTRDVEETAETLAKMNTAEGDVGVMQAKAGLDAILIRQNSELKYILAANNQKLGMESARQAAERDQADKKSKVFMEGYDTFTDSDVTPFHFQ